MTIEELLSDLELHDSTLRSLQTEWNGEIKLFIDFDEVWNKGIDPTFCGIRFPSVYEIVNYKIDRMNIIGSLQSTEIEDYDRTSVVHDSTPDCRVMMVDFEFVTGEHLSLVCADQVEYMKDEA